MADPVKLGYLPGQMSEELLAHFERNEANPALRAQRDAEDFQRKAIEDAFERTWARRALAGEIGDTADQRRDLQAFCQTAQRGWRCKKCTAGTCNRLATKHTFDPAGCPKEIRAIRMRAYLSEIDEDFPWPRRATYTYTFDDI